MDILKNLMFSPLTHCAAELLLPASVYSPLRLFELFLRRQRTTAIMMMAPNSADSTETMINVSGQPSSVAFSAEEKEREKKWEN